MKVIVGSGEATSHPHQATCPGGGAVTRLAHMQGAGSRTEERSEAAAHGYSKPKAARREAEGAEGAVVDPVPPSAREGAIDPPAPLLLLPAAPPAAAAPAVAAGAAAADGGDSDSFRGIMYSDRGTPAKYKRTRNGLRLKCRYGSDVRVVAMSKSTTFRALYTRLVHDYGFDLRIRCVWVPGAVCDPPSW
jgi:hypothetical protein